MKLLLYYPTPFIVSHLSKISDCLGDYVRTNSESILGIRSRSTSKVKDFTALHKFLFDEIDNYAKGHIASVILILAESQYQDAFAVDKELHVMSTIVKLLNELK